MEREIEIGDRVLAVAAPESSGVMYSVVAIGSDNQYTLEDCDRNQIVRSKKTLEKFYHHLAWEKH